MYAYIYIYRCGDPGRPQFQFSNITESIETNMQFYRISRTSPGCLAPGPISPDSDLHSMRSSQFFLYPPPVKFFYIAHESTFFIPRTSQLVRSSQLSIGTTSQIFYNTRSSQLLWRVESILDRSYHLPNHVAHNLSNIAQKC